MVVSSLLMSRELVSQQSSGSLRVGTMGRWMSLHSVWAQSKVIVGLVLGSVEAVDDDTTPTASVKKLQLANRWLAIFVSYADLLCMHRFPSLDGDLLWVS